MARRNRDLAGLAALGALGYMATRGRDDARGVGEGRKESLESEERRPLRLPDDFAERETGIIPQDPRGLNELGDRYTLENRVSSGPAAPANRSMAAGSRRMPSADEDFPPVQTRRRNVAGDYTRKMGATAEEIEAYRNRPSATRSTDKRPDFSTPEGRKRAEQEQALERVTPEEMLIGGPGLKALHGAAKRLAAPRIAEYSPPLLSGPTARLTGPSRAELAASDRAARDAARRAETARENAARYNTEGPLGGEGFIMRKKGGMVKAKKMASGGFTSASKRADGIASRGKTKCKMY